MTMMNKITTEKLVDILNKRFIKHTVYSRDKVSINTKIRFLRDMKLFRTYYNDDFEFGQIVTYISNEDCIFQIQDENGKISEPDSRRFIPLSWVTGVTRKDYYPEWF